MTMPPEGLMEACVQMEYIFRKTITSDFSDENIRTFEAKPPYLCSKKSDVLRLPECRLSLLLQKKFLKNTCISYTTYCIQITMRPPLFAKCDIDN